MHLLKRKDVLKTFKRLDISVRVSVAWISASDHRNKRIPAEMDGLSIKMAERRFECLSLTVALHQSPCE